MAHQMRHRHSYGGFQYVQIPMRTDKIRRLAQEKIAWLEERVKEPPPLDAFKEIRGRHDLVDAAMNEMSMLPPTRRVPAPRPSLEEAFREEYLEPMMEQIEDLRVLLFAIEEDLPERIHILTFGDLRTLYLPSKDS